MYGRYSITSLENRIENALNGGAQFPNYAGETFTAKEINRMARNSGLIAEVNTEQGFIELLDNEFRQIAICERIFI